MIVPNIENNLSGLYVRDLMSTNLFTLHVDDSFKLLRTLLDWQRIRHVPVVNSQEQLVGLVTHRDLLRVLISELSEISEDEIDEAYSAVRVKDIMKSDMLSIEQNVPIEHAARIIFENKFGCLPVVEKGKLIGILTEADFVKVFMRSKF